MTMYESDLTKLITSSTVSGAGIAALPNTSGSKLGFILACLAITVGVVALLSQLAVRVIRHHYTKRQQES